MSNINYEELIIKGIFLGKHIPSKKWMNTEMTDTMKEIFDYYFRDSRILFSIPIKDTELQIIDVEIGVINRNYADFINIIHRAMPYPILLFLNCKDDWFKVSYALTHTNKNNSFREVVEKTTSSGWIKRDVFEVLLYNIDEIIEAGESTREVLYERLNSILPEFQKTRKFISLRPLLEERRRQYHVLSESGLHYLERLSNIVSQLRILKDLSEDNDYYLTETNYPAVLERFEAEISHINDEMIYSVVDLTREYHLDETQDEWCHYYESEEDLDYDIMPSENQFSEGTRFRLNDVFNDYSDMLKESVSSFSEQLVYFFEASETLDCLTGLIKDMQNWNWG